MNKKKNKLTLQQKANRFPPIVCRLLARTTAYHNSVDAMSDEAIIAASDGRLTMAEVAGLSYTMAWNNVPFEIMMAFTKACGVDFDDREALQRHAKMMDQGRFGYLRKSSLWKTHFERIYREWTRHLNH